jgi:hypothetical protein
MLKFEAPEDEALRLRTSQCVLMITAADDSFIPRSSSDALWDAIRRSGAKAERRMMPGDHLQPGSDELIHKIMGEVQGWLRAQHGNCSDQAVEVSSWKGQKRE